MSTLNYIDENGNINKFGIIPQNVIDKVIELNATNFGNFTLAGTITAVGGYVTIPATANEVFIYGTIRKNTYNGDSAFCKRTSGDITSYSVSLDSSDSSILWEALVTLNFETNTVTLGSANKIIASTTTIDPYYRVFYR